MISQMQARLSKHANPARVGAYAKVIVDSALSSLQSPGSIARPIDVIMPVTEKDFATLQAVLDSFRLLGHERVSAVYLVTPDPSRLPALSSPFQLRFLSDDQVLADLDLPTSIILGGVERAGWVRQQFVKLSSSRIAAENYFLWHDADTMFSKPVRLIRRGKTQLYVAREFHVPYQQLVDRVLTGSKRRHLSYVTHSMLVRREVLEALLAELDRGDGWHNALLQTLDRTEPSALSEYDLYARFALDRYPNEYSSGLRMHRNKWAGFRGTINPRWSTVSRHVRA